MRRTKEAMNKQTHSIDWILWWKKANRRDFVCIYFFVVLSAENSNESHFQHLKWLKYSCPHFFCLILFSFHSVPPFHSCSPHIFQFISFIQCSINAINQEVFFVTLFHYMCSHSLVERSMFHNFTKLCWINEMTTHLQRVFKAHWVIVISIN